jgi:signal peptidase II
MKNWQRVSLGVFLLDQLSKIIFLKFFPQKVFFNKGISFGFLPSESWLIINLIIVALIILGKKREKAEGLIIGGALSNLIDRLFRGGVVDFINFNFGLPIFNLADIFICLGVVLLFLL